MSELLLPGHVARKRAIEERKKVLAEQTAKLDTAVHNPLTKVDPEQLGADVVNPLDTPIPEGLPEPQQWRVTLMPVNQRQRFKGSSLWVAPETLDVQNWTHQLWKVCKVGGLVYSGPAWNGFPAEALEEARAKLVPGALFLVDPKAPRRYYFHGKIFIVVNDDQLWSWVDPEQVEHLTFKGEGL